MILVTGATGNVGSNIVRQLAARGVRLRVLTRQPQDARFPGDVELATGDLTDPSGLSAAFGGISQMFLFPAPKLATELAALVRQHGIRRMVVLSSSVVERQDLRDSPIVQKHAAAETIAQTAGCDWTILRPDTFAANALAWAESIRTQSQISAPYPRSHRNAIHESDIAAVAVAALLEDGHEGTIYSLTGPESLTQFDQVAAIGAAIGRSLRFEELSPEDAKRQMIERMPVAVADQLLAYLAKCVDTPARFTDTVERVTGRPARSFAEWARDHADAFR